MAYGLQFFFETKSFHGKTSRLELLRKDFTGTPKRIIKGNGDPINVKWEGTNSDNPYYPIWGSSLTFNFYEQNGIGLEQIATDFERDVRVDFYVQGSLFWRGWVMPDLCNDIAYRDNAQISIIATDGLGALSKIKLLTSDTDKVVLSETIGTGVNDWNWNRTGLISNSPDYNYNATIKPLLEVLKICINKAELDIGVQIINDLYPVDLATKDERQLEYLLIDVLCYQKDGESKTCEEVLVSILQTFGCVLFQRDGFWFIERINYLDGIHVTSEVYDKDFKFLTKKTDNVRTYLRPTEDNDTNEWWFKTEGFIRRLRPPYQYQTIEYEYSESLDICPDSLLWRSPIGIETTNWRAVGLTAQKMGVQLQGTNWIRITDPDVNVDAGTVSQNTGFYSPPIDVKKKQEVKIQFELLALEAFLFVKLEGVSTGIRGGGTATTYYWRHTDNRWGRGVQDNQDVLLKMEGLRVPSGSGQGNDFISEFSLKEITLPVLPESGKLMVILKGGRSKFVTDSVRGGSSGIGLRLSVDYKNFKVDGGLIKEVHSFDIPKTVSFEAENLTVLNGDSLLGLTDKSTFLVETSEETTIRGQTIVTKKLIGTTKWKDSSEQESDTVLGFTARSILNQYSTRHNIIEGTVRTRQNLKIGSLLSFDSFKKFAYERLLICPPFNYNARQDTYDLNLFQLSCDLAKGRLSQYWSDSNGVPIYKNIFDYAGVDCMPTFEVETVCTERLFTLETVC